MIATTKANQLVVGDRMADGGEVTMIGASTTRPGQLFVALRLPTGHRSVTMSPDALIELDTSAHLRS